MSAPTNPEHALAPEIASRPLTQAAVIADIEDHLDRHPEYLLILGNHQFTPRFYEAMDALDLHSEDVEKLDVGYFVRDARLTETPRLFYGQSKQEAQIVAEDGIAVEQEATAIDLLALSYLSERITRTPEGDARFETVDQTWQVRGGDILADPRDVKPLFGVVKSKLEAIQQNLENAWPEVGRRLLERSPAHREELHEALLTVLENNDELRSQMLRTKPIDELYERAAQGEFNQTLLEAAGLEGCTPADALERLQEHVNVAPNELASCLIHSSPGDGKVECAESDITGETYLFTIVTTRIPEDVKRVAMNELRASLAIQAADPKIDPLFYEYLDDTPTSCYPTLLDATRVLPEKHIRNLLDGTEINAKSFGGFAVLRNSGFDFAKATEAEIGAELEYAQAIVRGALWGHLCSADRDLFPAKERFQQQLRDNPQTRIDQNEIASICRSIYEDAKRYLHRSQEINSYIRAHGLRGGKPTESNWYQVCLEPEGVSEEVLIRQQALRGETIYRLGHQYSRYLEEQEPDLSRDEWETRERQFLGRLVNALDRHQDVIYALEELSQLEDCPSWDHLEEIRVPEEFAAHIEQEEIALARAEVETIALHHEGALEFIGRWRKEREGDWSGIEERPITSLESLEDHLELTLLPEDVQTAFLRAARERGLETIRRQVIAFQNLRYTGFETVSVTDRDCYKWLKYVDRLSVAEVDAITSTMDTRQQYGIFRILLSAYDPERDPLRESGPIKSLRELQSRTTAITAGFSEADVAAMPQVLREAPGFDFKAYSKMQSRPDFRALAEGALDVEQPFEPRSERISSISLQEALRIAVGIRSEGIPGQANQPSKLYHSVKHLLTDRRYNKNVSDLFSDVPLELEAPLLDLIEAHERTPGMLTGGVLEATIHAKSDPEGWVCGNYTDCCMPFGRSINNDYMVNPEAQYFTVKLGGRIVAQSVVLRTQENGKDVIVLDSVEVASNSQWAVPNIRETYLKFWGRHFPETTIRVGGDQHHPFDPEFTDTIDASKIPRTPVDYSDAWTFRMYPFQQPGKLAA